MARGELNYEDDRRQATINTAEAGHIPHITNKHFSNSKEMGKCEKIFEPKEEARIVCTGTQENHKN